ncbi:YitT family protein [Arthrobacter sp. AD-310]
MSISTLPTPATAGTGTGTGTGTGQGLTTAAPAAPPSAVRHSLLEDVLGILTGTFAASLGLYLLKSSEAVTGGTAGLALLLSYTLPLPFGVIFFGVNLPFFGLAVWKKGWNFALRTGLAIALVSAMASLHPWALGPLDIDPVYGVLGGNLLAGVGLLILFRHKSSLGGFSILALLLQEKLKWRAGYVQMVLDVAIVLAALVLVSPWMVLLSAVGATLLNLILALNHRPGRYLGK